MSSVARGFSRGIAKKVKAIDTAEGAGAVVRRSIGTPALRNISPFLMLDHFTVKEGAGFPDHPHRGMTTVTLTLQGYGQHEDFAGHHGTMAPGDVQWMNAGRGIMHSEMPLHRDKDGKKLPDPIGLQLWVDLPKEAKKEPPSYQEYRAAEMPHVEAKADEDNGEKGFKIKVVAGESHGVRSPIELPKNGGVLYLEIRLEPEGSVYQTIDPIYNAFIYTLEGSITIGDSSAKASEAIGQHHTLVLTKNGEQGVRITNASKDTKAWFVLVAGEPLDQGVVQHGPFVMTNHREIQEAIKDFQTGSNGFERAPGWKSKIGAKLRR